jgi:hypothetical protein
MTMIVIDTDPNREPRAPRLVELRDAPRLDLASDHAVDPPAKEPPPDELARATWEDAEWQ